MSKKFLVLVALLAAFPAFAQNVQYISPVTRNHIPVWNTNGVIADGGSSADSPITSLGVTNEGGAGFCVSSQRQTAAGRNQLCFGASTNAAATISLQNYGTAAAQNLQFVINGTAVTIPTGGNAFVTGNGPFTSGDVPCFSGTSGLVIDCGLALASGVVTSGTWQGTPVGVLYGGTGATSAGGARTNLGLGTIATQNANSVAITGGAITGMPTPTQAADVAIKSYVDSTSTGLNVLAASGLATTTVLPNTPTYANGTAGVGATLTAGTNTTLTVDSVVATINTVVLVKNQAAAAQNGIYTLTTAGGGVAWVLTRATYFNTAAEMKVGSYTFVTAGTTNASSAFTLQSAVTTVGTDPLNWVQFSTSGTGSVTNVIVAPGTGINNSGTCTITATGTCTVSVEQMTPGGRLTLASATPVMAASQTAQTSIYYAPYKNKYVPIYTSGTGMRLLPFTSSDTDNVGLTLALGTSWAASSNYDSYAYVNGSSAGLCTGPDWSQGAVAGSNVVGSSSRGTGAGSTQLQLFKGLFTNQNIMTCRTSNSTTISCAVNECTYLGTFRTTSSTGQVSFTYGTSGTAGTFDLWNAYNQEYFCSSSNDSVGVYTYGTSTTRQADASAINQFNFITGAAGSSIDASYFVDARSSLLGNQYFAGIALNSTTTLDASANVLSPGTSNFSVTLHAADTFKGVLGANFISANELGDNVSPFTLITVGTPGALQRLKACLFM